MREFSRALAGADTGILFYAGHGLQVGQRNYLIPVDAQLQSERDLEFETVALDFVMRQMEIDREGKTNLVFLDACRDNPLARGLSPWYVLGMRCRDQCKTTKPSRPIIPSLFSSAQRSGTPLSCC